MERAEDASSRSTSTALAVVRSRTKAILRITRQWASIATVAALWLWLLASHAATGSWASTSPSLVLLMFLLLAPTAVLWLFYHSARQLVRLPDELRKLMAEGRIRSSDLATSVRTWGSQPSGRRAWTVLRAILELRTFAFRGRGLLLATGVALRFRFLNPLVLASVFVAFLASGAIVLGAVAATVLALLLAL